MAFIRDYADVSGDPFSLRIPKKLRKLTFRKVGRGLSSVFRPALGIAGGLIPGVGTALEFARGYGLDMGDPPHHKAKRKAAGAGPKHKSKMKSANRAIQHAKKTGGLSAKEAAHILASNAGAALGGVASVIGALKGGPGAAMGEIMAQSDFPGIGGGALPHGMRLPGMGGHRRRQNFANVKALRRSLRRVEGFERLVKSVERAYPRLKRAVHHPAPHRKKRGR